MTMGLPRVIIMVLLAVLFTGSLISGAEGENPFGFKTYTYPKGCNAGKVMGYITFVCPNAPRTHPDIENYYLYFMEDIGLCNIAAATSSYESTDSLLGLATKMMLQLSEKYGAPTQEAGEGLQKNYKWRPPTKLAGASAVKTIRLYIKKFEGMTDPAVVINFVLKQQAACDDKRNALGRRAF